MVPWALNHGHIGRRGEEPKTSVDCGNSTGQSERDRAEYRKSSGGLTCRLFTAALPLPRAMHAPKEFGQRHAVPSQCLAEKWMVREKLRCAGSNALYPSGHRLSFHPSGVLLQTDAWTRTSRRCKWHKNCEQVVACLAPRPGHFAQISHTKRAPLVSGLPLALLHPLVRTWQCLSNGPEPDLQAASRRGVKQLSSNQVMYRPIETATRRCCTTGSGGQAAPGYLSSN